MKILRKKNSGQFLPLLSISLILLVVFIGANGERARLGIEKIRNQRTADSLVLTSMNEESRALNAIGALNMGISKMLHQLELYGTITTALAACAAISFWVPPAAICIRPAASTLKYAPTFIKKVKRTVKKMAHWQDEFVKWAAYAPQRTLWVYNYNSLSQLLESHAFLYPKKVKLYVQRMSDSDFDNQMKNISSCSKDSYTIKPVLNNPNVDPLNPFDKLKSQKPSPQIKLYYKEYPRGDKTMELNGFPSSLQITKDQTTYQLDSGEVKPCKSFSSLLGKADQAAALLAGFPKPYQIITPDFFSKQKLTIGLANYATPTWIQKTNYDKLREDQAFAPLLDQSIKESPISVLDKAEKILPSWSLSEASIDGDDLTEMNFRVDLSKVTKDRELNNLIGRNLGGIGKLVVYDKEKTHANISH